MKVTVIFSIGILISCIVTTGGVPIFPFINAAEREQFRKQQYPETSQLLPIYDFIIVGAGSAGCVLANRLSEISDWKVLLIEAGDYETLDMDVPALAGQAQTTDADWQYVTEPMSDSGLGLQDHRFAYPRGKVVGGSSVLNFMIYTRGNRDNYNRWETVYKNPGWSFQHVEKYFKKLENYQVENSDDFGRSGPIHIKIPEFHTNFSNHLLDAVTEYGLPVVNINGPIQEGVSRLQTTIKDGLRMSTNRGYLMPIRDQRPNLHLKVKCHVNQVVFSGRKAIGVQMSCASGERYFIRTAREVILSAGAINSPQILMLSGVGREEHLREFNIPLIVNLPVGDNLMDHIGPLSAVFTINQTILPNIVEIVSMYMWSKTGPLSIPGGAIEVFAFSQPVENIPSMEHLILGTVISKEYSDKFRLTDEVSAALFGGPEVKVGVFPLLQTPRSRGFVRLRSRDPFDPPRIYPNYLTHPDDIEMLLAGIKEAIEIFNQSALRQYGARIVDVPLPMCANYSFGTDDYWRCTIRVTTFHLYHQAGTCQMGTVVDAELRVFGTSGLRVVDASIMPEIISGHLNGPVIMIAEHASDMIKAFWNRL